MAEYETNHSNSYGLGVAGTTLGAIGTGLSLMNGGLANLFGGGMATTGNGYVTREAFEMAQKVAQKDSEIALLKSEQNTEIKIADVYERLITRINADAKAQAEVNSAQAVFNAGANSAIAVLQSQIGVLNGLTRTIVPIGNVCPEPMPLKNSWTAPTE